ncbi:hypothetical protein L227DRAFT_568708, partial [Lentinus tigrinus ALCF2SS1-6]
CQHCGTFYDIPQLPIPQGLRQEMDELMDREREEGHEEATAGIGQAEGSEDIERRGVESAIKAVADFERQEQEQHRAREPRNATPTVVQRAHGNAERLAAIRESLGGRLKSARLARRARAFGGELVSFPDGARCDLAALPYVQSVLANESSTLSHAQYWDGPSASWDPAFGTFALPRGAPMLLFRVKEMHCGSFGIEVQRLEEYSPDSEFERMQAKAKGEQAWHAALTREHFVGSRYVVLWYEVRVAHDGSFVVGDDDSLHRWLAACGSPAELELWDREDTDWNTFHVQERIYAAQDHTVLMRIPDIVGLRHLGVEMRAQYVEPEIIGVDDPRYPWKEPPNPSTKSANVPGHGESSRALSKAPRHAARRPLGSRNAVKLDADIDLTIEDDAERLRRVNAATVTEDNREVLDVDLFQQLM